MGRRTADDVTRDSGRLGEVCDPGTGVGEAPHMLTARNTLNVPADRPPWSESGETPLPSW